MHKIDYISILCMFFIINQSCLGEPTRLMKAIRNNASSDAIHKLIVDGENVNYIDIEFLRWVKPVLRYALDHGTDEESEKIIKMLVEAGADVNMATYNRVKDRQVYGMMPLLTYAAIYSSAEIVQILVDAGAQDRIESETSISFKKSALEIAHELGRRDIVAVLLNKRRK